MQIYVLRRLLAPVPTLFFARHIVFATVRLLPGSIVDLMLSQNDIAVGKDRAHIEAALGLDRPMYEQYVRWISAALRGDKSPKTIPTYFDHIAKVQARDKHTVVFTFKEFNAGGPEDGRTS